MVRYTDYSPALPIAGGAGTMIIPYQALRGSNVVGFTITMTGAGNILNGAGPGLTRIRVLVNGNVWWDVDAAHFVAFTERFSKSNLNMAAAATFFLLPFFDPIPTTEDEQDQMQLPAGQPEIHLVFGAGSAAGFVEVGIIRTTILPTSTSRLYGSAMNIAASQNNASYLFSAPGILRGYVLNIVGISRAILSLGGIEAHKFTGPAYTPTAQTAIPSQQWYCPYAFVNPVAFSLGEQYPAPAEGTQLLVDTSAAWAGVGNELTRFVAIPYQGAVA